MVAPPDARRLRERAWRSAAVSRSPDPLAAYRINQGLGVGWRRPRWCTRRSVGAIQSDATFCAFTVISGSRDLDHSHSAIARHVRNVGAVSAHGPLMHLSRGFDSRAEKLLGDLQVSGGKAFRELT